MGETATAKTETLHGTGFSPPEHGSLPRVMGRLFLLRLIARGGMGDVYWAATTGLEGAERPCVVKTIRKDHAHDGSFLARFLDEARVQSQLQHPGVAQVLEAATDENGEPYTVVEYVEGRSLADVRQRAIAVGVKLDWPEAVCVTIEMAQALAHVHERSGPDGVPLGIVHRDLSPQNVMLSYAGEVKVIDFGTARGHNRRCHTVAGVVFAKPGYVAPEVARQQVGDGRIDLYAMGIMLWEMCAGRRFFAGDPQGHLEDAARGRILVPKIAADLGAPALLDEVIGRLTANEPDDRYARAALVVPDLARLLALSPAAKGERGVRARITGLMRALWPSEPAKSRAEFARLLREARALRREANTPPASGMVQSVAERMAPSDPDVIAGTPYKLIRKIGEGASGTVHEAEHVELGRRLAIKILSPDHTAPSDATERFRKEARAVAKLVHPNLVPLYDFGRSLDGRTYLVMELLSGETLDRTLARKGPFAWQDAVRTAMEVCRALEAAHEAGLIHRDLKPQNLFVTEGGTLKLLDFGVAMVASDKGGKTRGFAIFGTPEYMAPEQVSGDAVDARADLYALGIVLYELLTGKVPFEGDSAFVVMGKQLRDVPVPPREYAPTLPTPVEALVLRLLEKKPEDRFASAEALRDALLQILALPTKERALLRRRRRARVAFSMATVGAVALACVALYKRSVPPVSSDDAVVSAITPETSVDPALASGDPVEVAEAVRVEPSEAVRVEPTEAVRVEPSEAVRVEPTEADKAEEKAEARGPVLSKEPFLEPPKAGASRIERVRALSEARLHVKGRGNDPAALRTWAWAAYHAHEFREARRAAHAWALRDGTLEPRVVLSLSLEGSGRKAEARAVLSEWLQVHPDSAEAWNHLARMSGGDHIGKSLARR